jgi:hypothetical protein
MWGRRSIAFLLVIVLLGCATRSAQVVIQDGASIDFLIQIARKSSGSTNIPEVAVPAELQRYRTAWEFSGSPALSRMEHLLQMRFSRNLMDVYVLNWAGAPSHDPLMLPFTTEESADLVFVSSLVHELVHKLLQDNITVERLNRIQQATFSEDSEKAAAHAIVFGVMQCAYAEAPLLDMRVINVARQQATMGAKPDDPYVRAWQIVDQRGCRKIIDDFHKNMSRMR